VIAAIAFVFGLVVGSFLNVCIRRIPAGVSIVHPRSRCPACQAPIRALDNIPVLSYLLLRGKCRACGARISPVYPAVELLTGLLFSACYLKFGLTLAGAKWAIFSALMVVLIFTDILERLLPDAVNFAGFGFALGVSLFLPVDDGTALWLANKMFEFPPPAPALSLVDALLGAALGSGLLWIVAEGYFRLRGREGMGLGDVKMMLMVGAFLGVKRTLMTILAGSVAGTVIGLLLIGVFRKGGDYELPFGTFLGGAAVLVVLFGTPLLEWYLGLFR
jgi:leader peptidase (prepilin peptidase)/N-methyltransferase